LFSELLVKHAECIVVKLSWFTRSMVIAVLTFKYRIMMLALWCETIAPNKIMKIIHSRAHVSAPCGELNGL